MIWIFCQRNSFLEVQTKIENKTVQGYIIMRIGVSRAMNEHYENKGEDILRCNVGNCVPIEGSN
jgi:hypothetical protein